MCGVCVSSFANVDTCAWADCGRLIPIKGQKSEPGVGRAGRETGVRAMGEVDAWRMSEVDVRGRGTVLVFARKVSTSAQLNMHTAQVTVHEHLARPLSGTTMCPHTRLHNSALTRIEGIENTKIKASAVLPRKSYRWATGGQPGCNRHSGGSILTVMGIARSVIFLGNGLKLKRNLVVHKALQYLGDVFLSEGDDTTATNLFTVALDGFTAMDILKSRAECLLQLGNLSQKGGNPISAVKLWETARPLFERSSQHDGFFCIDKKLNDAMEHLGAYDLRNAHHPGAHIIDNPTAEQDRTKSTVHLAELLQFYGSSLSVEFGPWVTAAFYWNFVPPLPSFEQFHRSNETKI
ncbi:hypothetical protein C8R44DRAFT_754254 [Mycena epipterygia]|nr:hypothetical protein C8R44DRAFT_754254 [Mycena epipterygia]